MSVLHKWLYLISFGVILYTAFFFYPRWEQSRTEATIGSVSYTHLDVYKRQLMLWPKTW